VVYIQRANDDVKIRHLTRDVGSLDEYPIPKEWIKRRVLCDKKGQGKAEKEYMAGR